MRSSLTISVALGALATLNCEQIPICGPNPDHESCALTIKNAIIDGKELAVDKTFSMSKFTSHEIVSKITGGTKFNSSGLPFSMSIIQKDKTCVSLNPTPKEDYTFHITVTDILSKSCRIGDGVFMITGENVVDMAQKFPIKWTHQLQPYGSPVAYPAPSAGKGLLPFAEYIGINNGIIYSLSSGITSGMDSRKINKYGYTINPAGLAKIQDDYLGATVIGGTSTPLVAVASQSAYLSHNPVDGSAGVLRCPVVARMLVSTDCISLMFTLPVGSQAVVVTPDETRMVVADNAGGIQWGALSGQPGTLAWKSVAAKGPGVRLTTTDLDGDGKADIVAVWSAGSTQQAAAYLATAEGFSENTAVSMQLTTAIGSTPITALAAGDVDSDGFGDVVIARGRELVVLQSQLDSFQPGPSIAVDPASGTTTINAIALGRLDAAPAAGMPLDIVTASNTGYNNAMNENTMYLHAFRPGPP